MPLNKHDRLVVMDDTTRKKRLEKIIQLLKFWKGPAPDYEHLDFSRYHQTEEEYQKEQKQWLEERRREKEKRKNPAPGPQSGKTMP